MVLVQSSGDIGHRDVRLLLVCGTKKNTFEELEINVSFQLLKIIHIPGCEQFHVETIFFLYHGTGGIKHLLMNTRFT